MTDSDPSPGPGGPLPDDGIYRMILTTLVASVIVGALVALAGEMVWHDKGISHLGAWIALICGGLYFVFRFLGRREMRRRSERGGRPPGGSDDPAD